MSRLSLDAIGNQDTYLTGGPTSLFDYENVQHSNFALYNRRYRISEPDGVPNWPFGKTILITLNPQSMGDMLSAVYIKCTMPVLSDAEGNESIYTDQIGRAILNEVVFRVDRTVLDTVSSDLSVIKDEFYLTNTEKQSLQDLINAGNPPGALPTSTNRAGPFDLYIPLSLFFSRKNAFPLHSIYNQTITVSLEFKPVSFFSTTNTGVSLPFFELVTEEISLMPAEKAYLRDNEITYIMESTIQNPITSVNKGDTLTKINLVPNTPVKALYWFIRKTEYELKNTTESIINRYNFSSSSNTNISIQSLNPIMSDMSLYLYGHDVKGFMGETTRDNTHSSKFHKYVQPQEHGLYTPERNVYMYSFALDLKSINPNGSIDFGLLKSDNTFMHVSLLNIDGGVGIDDDYTIHVYYAARNVIRINDGFAEVVTSS